MLVAAIAFGIRVGRSIGASAAAALWALVLVDVVAFTFCGSQSYRIYLRELDYAHRGDLRAATLLLLMLAAVNAAMALSLSLTGGAIYARIRARR